jgi:hypothetical protein
LTQSIISQEDADNSALDFLSGLTANTESTWISEEQKPGVTASTLTFTHELKFESPAAKFDVAYDNADSSGITINKILYYDINGRYSVLDGYYSKNADDGVNYKKFYQTSGGSVVDIYTMSSSTANTVQSQQTSTIYPLMTGYTGYTSFWYFTSPIIEDTFYHELNNLFGFNETWNTSEFYSNPIVRRGFTNTPILKGPWKYAVTLTLISLLCFLLPVIGNFAISAILICKAKKMFANKIENLDTGKCSAMGPNYQTIFFSNSKLDMLGLTLFVLFLMTTIFPLSITLPIFIFILNPD